MGFIYNFFYFTIFFLSLSLIRSDSPLRTIEVEKQCKNISGVNIIYVKASSTKDVLHYVYAAVDLNHTLSVIIIKSKQLNSTLKINCNDINNGYENQVFNLSDKIYSAFGLVFTKLYEYSNEEIDMNVNEINTRSFENFKWQVNLADSNKSIIFRSTGLRNSSDNLLSNGTIMLKFNVSGELTRAKGKPRLWFTGNNTQIDVILSSLNTMYKTSRFAIEVAFINKFNLGEMKIENINSLDDEYSPGVFAIKNFYGQPVNQMSLSKQTYLQWKPVCYQSATDHTLNKLSVTTNFDPVPYNKNNRSREIIKSSMAYLFFGEGIFKSDSTMTLLNTTFGISGDHGYKPFNYTIWTLSFGVGKPRVDEISTTVILVISFGLGLPFILVVVGSIYLVIKKRMNRRLSYETIEDPIN